MAKKRTIDDLDTAFLESTPSPKRRKSYSLAFKLKILKEVKENCNNCALVARRNQVDESMIRRWKRETDKITSAALVSKKTQKIGCGRKPMDEELEDEVFTYVASQRAQNLEVSRKKIQDFARDTAVSKYKDHDFVASTGWVTNFMRRMGLSLRQKTHQSQKLPSDLIPKVLSFLTFIRQYYEVNTITDDYIIAMDQTAVFYDMASSKTITFTGDKTVSLATTGHEKLNITVILAASSNGKKLKPYCIFKGKGKSKEFQALKARRDINVEFSANGWCNQELTMDWISKNFSHTSFCNRLLIMDSYRCHISKETKALLKQKRIHSAIIPGGCTGILQAPDVSWNKPFKAKLRELYGKWLEHGNHTFTKHGNIRAVSKNDLCDMVLQAWNHVSEEIIIKSFFATGQAKTCQPEDISCLKETGIAHEALESVKEMWTNPLQQKLVNNCDQEDLEQLEINECVVHDDDE